MPKARLIGLKVKVRVGATPVPLRGTDCGLAFASSVKTTDAARAPVAVGAKVTVTVQAIEAFRVEPQELAVIEKSPGLVPPNAIDVNVTVEFPVFVTWND